MERCRSGYREMNDEHIEQRRARGRELAAEFAERGDNVGWFEAFYAEAAGDNQQIPWADLEPNAYFRRWAEDVNLTGNGRKALVVGCGLGDDARYLHDLGFKVSAFDISPTAIEWAKRLHAETDIKFEAMDLFEPFRGWLGAFEFVLEVYTIQPLPMELRERVIDSIAGFVADDGELVVVTRAREDDAEPVQLPWPLSRKDLSRFEANGFQQLDFRVMDGVDDDMQRFVVRYAKARP